MVVSMTSAYEGGAVPQIEVRHRLRIAREYAALEQSQLAELIGVSRTSISNAENGAVTPRKITVNAWALACGVPASWLNTGQTPEPPHPDGGVEQTAPTRLPKSRNNRSDKPTDVAA
jgi:transcriptional regulator with XRE-family HTH domain